MGAPMARLSRRVGIQPGATMGRGTRPPRRAAARGVMVPSGTTLTGPSTRRRSAARKAAAASSTSSRLNAAGATQVSDRALTGTTGSRSTRLSGLGYCTPTVGAKRRLATGTSAIRPAASASCSTARRVRP